MTVRIKSTVLRVPLLVLAALFLGGLAALVGSLYHPSAAAGNPPTCGGGGTSPASPYTVNLTGGTVTLTDDGGSPANLTVSSSGGSCAPIAFNTVSEIDFAVAGTVSTASTVVLDQTGGAVFPCVQIGGTVGTSGNNDGVVKIVTTSSESVTVGSNGVNLAGCALFTTGSSGATTAASGTFSGLQSYQIVDAGPSSGITISAGGGSDTGSAASVPVTVTAGTSGKSPKNVGTSTFIGGAGSSNSFTVVATTGSANSYVVGTGPASFIDSGSGNSIDFSNATVSPSSHLAINVSGAPQSVGGTTLQSGQAEVGTPGSPTYTFTSATGANDPSPFKTIIGASGGDTDVFAGDETAPLNLTGFDFRTQGSANSANFSAATHSLTADFTSFPAHVFLSGGTDTFTPLGISTPLTVFTGSANGGDDYFAGANSPTGNTCSCTLTYTFTGNGTGNFFFGGTGVSGPGSATFKGGSGNLVDLANLTTPAIVDDSGQSGVSPPTGTATSSGSTYTFGGLSSPTTFIGSLGGTTFFGGTTADNFVGEDPGHDELNYGFLPSGTLVVCAAFPTSGACSQNIPSSILTLTGQAIVGTVHEGFNGITTFDGLSAGTTTFDDGNSTTSTPGGHVFNPSGGSNSADFSAVSPGVTANLSSATLNGVSSGQVGGPGLGAPDTISGLTTVIGSSSGGNLFGAGSSSETFGDRGSTGGDSIAFSDVATSGSTPLTVNVSGGPVGTVPNFSAAAGSAVYSFGNKGSNFTNFTGSAAGNTVYLAGNPSSYHFGASGSGNSIDYSAATSGVTADLGAGTVTLGGGTDFLSGLSVVTGSSQGGNTFLGGAAGPYTFTGNGTGNHFTASNASATYQGNGTGNIVDFSNLTTAPITVNVSGQQVQSTANGTATSGAATFSFGGLGAPTTFDGSTTAATTFDGGPAADRFNGQSGSDTLSYASSTTGSSLAFCIAAGTSGCTTANRAVLGTVSEPFSGITTFVGLAAGNTTFVEGGAGGHVFTATGTGNAADFSNAGSAVTVDFTVNQVTGLTSSDTFSGLNSVIGSTLGGNDFVAGTGSESFGDTGSTGGDHIDFSHVPTSGTTQLTVNVSGGPVGTLSNFTAQAGTSVYSFTNKGSNFKHFTGSLGGNTIYLATDPSGYAFGATGAGNSIDYSAASAGVTANLAAGTVTLGGGTDTLTGLSVVTGSSQGGNTFLGGAAGPYTFTGNGAGNHFVAGSGSDTFQGSGTGAIVDFSNLTSPVTVNVSGQQVQSTNNGTATTAGAAYNFGALASPITFKGSTVAATTFDAGSAADTFNGQSGSDTLSFASSTTGSTLAFCLTSLGSSPCTSGGQAVLGTVTESFTGISTFTGLASGNTTFVEGPGGGHTFNASGSGNAANFSNAGSSVTVDFTTAPGTVTGLGSTDFFSGISTVIGSTLGHNTFIAGSSSETYGDTGSAQGDLIDFENVASSGTTPLLVNVSGHPVTGVNSDTASVGAVTYNFTNKAANFQTFIGSNSGNTHFVASDATGRGGYTFTGRGSANTADFGLSGTGITADMTPVGCGSVNFFGGSPAPDRLAGTFVPFDLFTCPSGSVGAGSNSVIGSATGGNTFFGDVSGTTFTSQSPSNTLSYIHGPGGVTVNLSTDRVSGGGVADTFSFPLSSTPTIEGSPGTDVFTAGLTPATLQGGGGVDSLDLSQTLAPPFGNSGDFVDLQDGSVTGSGIGSVTFTPGCASATSLCVTSIHGSRFNDTYEPGSAALGAAPADFLSIAGGTGSDTLDLASVANSADICLPITGTSPLGTVPCTTTGMVQELSGAPNPAVFTSPAPISFTGVANVVGTTPGGDYVWGGTGTEQLQDSGAATLDLSNLPGISAGGPGATVTAGSGQAGSVTTPLSANSTYSWNGFENLTGTRGNDAFSQTAPGTFNFHGLGGTNTLDMSAVTGGAAMTFNPPVLVDGCTGTTNSDGTASSTQLTDSWTCMSSVIAPGQSSFNVSPGQTAEINGGGTGTLRLVADITGNGATVDMTTTPGTVSNDGYNFSFTGISTIIGTPFNDTFMPGASNVTINGGGGQDGLSYLGAPNAVDVNLSTANYLVPTGYFDAGNSVSACSAIGGFGGTVNFINGSTCTITNATGSLSNTDVLVAGRGQANLTGGAGSDRFVLTDGGNDQIVGGSGSSTLDLTLLSGHTTVDLGNPGIQPLGSGSLALITGNIKTVLASPGGSTLFGGTGSGVTLVGGPGDDVLAAGTGTQTLQGGGGSDLLIGGVGNDTMIGGAQPVTFVPGEGHDTLRSATTGNTLTYAGAIQPIQANLSAQPFSVPAGKPSAGTVLSAQTVTGGFPGSSVDLSQAPISHLTGSPFDDILVTGGNDVITGDGGDDLFVIEPGSSTLNAAGGSSSYFLFEGAGSEIVNGGGNSTVDFSAAPHGVTVNLQSGTASGGFGGTQALSGIQNVIGSEFDDVLVASAPGQTLTGLHGNDVLQAGPSGGDTLLSDGGGNDTFCSEPPISATQPASCDVPNTSSGGGSSAATENVMVGGPGNDTFFTRNAGFDSIDGGGGFNQAQIDSNDTAANIQVFLP